MRISILAAMILASGVGSLSWAQEPIRTPSAPAAGAPGTATPQPYGQPPTTSPIKRQGSAPLLPPPEGQRPPGSPAPATDQPIPQLEQQLQRNSQGGQGQQKRE